MQIFLKWHKHIQSICICSHAITWTLMLSLERNDSSARCASGGEGNIAATKFSSSNGQHKPDPPSSENLLIQRTSKLSGEADQLSHSRKLNVTPMTGRVTLPSTEPDRGCSSRLPRGERASIISPTAAFCRSRKAASCSSCCCFRRKSPANPAAVGGSSWIAKEPCNVHAKRGAVLITNQSSGASCCRAPRGVSVSRGQRAD